MEYKDIDRLFQEKLKDIEVAPNPKVWKAIEKKLQKKKRRVIPFWWFSGVAVAVLGVFLFFNTTKEQQKDVFPVTTKKIDSIENTTNKKEEGIFIIAKEDIEENKLIKDDVNRSNNHKKEKNIDVVINKKPKESKEVFPNSKIIVVKKSIQNTSEKKNTNEVSEKELFLIDKVVAAKENVKKQKQAIDKIISLDEKVAEKEERNIEKELNLVNSKIAEKDGNNSEGDILKGVFSSEEVVEKNNLTDKKSKPKKDFIVEVTKNKKEIAPEELENKWGVSPMVGVLKSNSFSQASALDESLNKNDFSGGNTLSYGINVSYKLNDKWAIKSGIQLQKTVFTTNDVVVTSSAFVTANDLENVVFNLNNGPSNSSNDDITTDFGQENITSENGNLIQSYGYIEIPIEVKYTFFSAKKIKTSVISGFSSLILNENSVVGESESFNDDIGGAGNLNTINFSGNFGIDFDFSISKKINLNINPMFKTQLNTFSNNSNGFKPYTIGVYSGIRYQF